MPSISSFDKASLGPLSQLLAHQNFRPEPNQPAELACNPTKSVVGI